MEDIMRGTSGMIALTLFALGIGGCAMRPAMLPDNKDSPYENTDRPIVPYQDANQPIMALDSDADGQAEVRSL